jgi:hypothetical protein
MRRLKSCLLILVALWLPLQAAAAATMPFCRHAAEQAALEEIMRNAAHCHEQAADAATVAADDFDCDNCRMCQFATAGYLLAARATLPPLAASILVSRLEPVSVSHIPEPPQQPPRR